MSGYSTINVRTNFPAIAAKLERLRLRQGDLLSQAQPEPQPDPEPEQQDVVMQVPAEEVDLTTHLASARLTAMIKARRSARVG